MNIGEEEYGLKESKVNRLIYDIFSIWNLDLGSHVRVVAGDRTKVINFLCKFKGPKHM